MGSQDTIRGLEKELIALRKQGSASTELEAKVVDLEQKLASSEARNAANASAMAELPGLKRTLVAQKATIAHLMNDLQLKQKKFTDE